MSTSVSHNFFQCLMKLQEKNHRLYSWQDIGEALGMSRQAARTLFLRQPTDKSFIKYSTIAALIDFFAAEDMPITVADLFTVDTPPPQPPG